MAEVVGVGTNIIAIGLLGFIVFKGIDLVIGLRVSPEAELEGLDVPEMGTPGYVGVSDGLLVPEGHMKSSFGSPQTSGNR